MSLNTSNSHSTMC